MKKFKNIFTLFLFVTIIFSACEPQLVDAPSVSPKPTLDDLVISIEQGEDANHWIIKNESQVPGIAYWDFGNEVSFTGDSAMVYYPDINTYQINLTLVTNGGMISKTFEHIQEVAVAPEPGSNLVKGGEFKDATDHAFWSLLAFPGVVTFNEGNAHFTVNNPWEQAGIYQAIEVEAGKTYEIDMHIESTTGLGNSWFEVYAGYAAPVEGIDYSDGGMKLSMNTWDGCGTAPFSGQLSEIGCKAENNTGIFEATETGTVYLVIRGGGEDFKDGVIITNVEMKEMP